MNKIYKLKEEAGTFVDVSKTCSCGTYYHLWYIEFCHVDEVGLWKDCFNCGSTMLHLMKGLKSD